ncbi:hypothetical protein E2C01_039829 [Portunus trituberculatus]|uniref:Uncharacterized protein n=1 Tax=Portunus trituberculatus TaxID=210409 RepID=A0A5B7FET6_PORTR|nr:hypothetical protein [Portunus trituberculatus]
MVFSFMTYINSLQQLHHHHGINTIKKYLRYKNTANFLITLAVFPSLPFTFLVPFPSLTKHSDLPQYLLPIPLPPTTFLTNSTSPIIATASAALSSTCPPPPQPPAPPLSPPLRLTVPSRVWQEGRGVTQTVSS